MSNKNKSKKTKNVPGRWANIVFSVNCNLHCNYCGRENLDFNIPEVIDTAKWTLETYPPDFIRFEGAGEVTLYPKIMDFIFKYKQSNPNKYIEVLTNGAKIQDYFKTCAENNISVVLSCDSEEYMANHYNRGITEDYHKRLLESIKMGSDLLGKKFEINTVITIYNVGQLFDYFNYLVNINFQGYWNLFPCTVNEMFPLGNKTLIENLKKQLSKIKSAKCNFGIPKHIFPLIIKHAEDKHLEEPCEMAGNYDSYHVGRTNTGQLVNSTWCECGRDVVEKGCVYSKNPAFAHINQLFEPSKDEQSICKTCCSHPRYTVHRLEYKGVL